MAEKSNIEWLVYKNMIFFDLANADRYPSLGAGFCAAFDYLRTFDPKTPPGKVIVNGDEVYAVVQEYTTAPAGERKWEAHRRYADVQFLVSGQELIYHSPLDLISSVQPYDEKGDYELFVGPDLQFVNLRAGDFGIFYPENGHKPGCSAVSAIPVKNFVMKVRLT